MSDGSLFRQQLFYEFLSHLNDTNARSDGFTREVGLVYNTRGD